MQRDPEDMWAKIHELKKEFEQNKDSIHKTVEGPPSADYTRSPIPLVYVAGAYRATTTAAVDSNIALAREIGKQVAKCGAYPVIPHANTAHFDGIDLPWLEATLELCTRCDAIVTCPGWERSEGSSIEVAEMTRLCRFVFHAPDSGPFTQLIRWVDEYKALTTSRRTKGDAR